MTTAAQTGIGTGARVPTVDVAGTAWPIYKLEAIAAGLVVFLGVLVILQSLQVAVLGSAVVSGVVWATATARIATRTD